MVAKVLYATMTAKEGQAPKVAELLSNLAQQIRANEPGNVRFVVYTLADNPNAFHVEETYADEDAFKAHMGTEHGKEFNRVVTPYIEGGASNVVFLNHISG